jgi:conjugative transposon protein TcpC
MSARASVTVTTRPLWRIRLSRELPRYTLYALAVWGLLASARYAIAPPKPPAPKLAHIEATDRAAEGFATLFARRYLSWNASQPEAYRRELEAYLGEDGAQTAIQLPRSGEQQVQWAQVVQSREGQGRQRVYTVAAQTDSAGLLYLAVSVLRKPEGGLALASFPAFVGAPAATSLDNVLERFHDVEEPALQTVVKRALRNYLADSASELAADLTSEAEVSLPGLELTLQSLQQLKWLPGHGSVFAVVTASDVRGATYTLTYQLDVSYTQGRWEISAIQMNPDT